MSSETIVLSDAWDLDLSFSGSLYSVCLLSPICLFPGGLFGVSCDGSTPDLWDKKVTNHLDASFFSQRLSLQFLS